MTEKQLDKIWAELDRFHKETSTWPHEKAVYGSWKKKDNKKPD
jgi:hypothetical protein